MEFNDENIRKIFGHEAAEDDNEDNLYSFYLKGYAYEKLKSDLPLYVLVGHKGTGKSALLKILEKDERKANNLPIMIRPDDIFDQTETDLNKMIKLWQEGLSKIIFQKLIETIFEINYSTNNKEFKQWLSKFSKLTLSLLGYKFADIRKYNIEMDYSKFLLLFKDVIFKEKKVTVFIDDLDRGWKNANHEIQNISAMLNALRTITRNIPNVKFRVALRSSVYYAVRTSDESTDKIENSIVWLKWNNHEILAMLVKRAILFDTGQSVDESYLLGLSQTDLSKYLKNVFEARFNGKGHWNNAPMHQVILSLIRQRPRDLVKLCNLAAQKAYRSRRELISTKDLEDIFLPYSQERLTDTVNEYSSEFSDIKRVLLEMRPSVNKKNSSFLYSPKELFDKMKQVIDHIGKVKFANGDVVTPAKLAVFLYKINFLTARKNNDHLIIRYYYDENKYIFNEDIDFGFEYEVHPAYRWALQPQNINDIYKNIDLTE